MSDAGNELTPKQIKLVAALLEGRTLEKAAEAAGTSYMTARRWRRDPAVIAALADGRRQLITSAMDILSAGARAAAGELLGVLRDPRSAPMVRLRAAEAILDRLFAWIELEDLAARVAALEDRNAKAD